MKSFEDEKIVKRWPRFLLTLGLCLGNGLLGSSPALSQALNTERLSAIPQLVEDAIRKNQTPGAVVIIWTQGRVVFRQSYGVLALGAQRLPVAPDTIFDLASLTKVVATTPAILQLVERGKLSLEDPICKYWPQFKTGNKDQIKVRHLLTHYSGLRSGLPLKSDWSGYETALKKILEVKLEFPPGSHFLYGDLNFIILGELIRRISGQPLDIYCRDHIFQPLGMKDTCFNPGPALHARLAPTIEIQHGEVHDPLARRMGGVAGHAGLFSTADDLAIFAQALLNRGRLDSVEILSATTVEKKALPHSPLEKIPLRGVGWEIYSPLCGNWSESFPPGSYGHKGFTGTLLWIDPISKTYLIVLTNRVYLSEKSDHETLRAQIFSLVAEATGRSPVSPVNLSLAISF